MKKKITMYTSQTASIQEQFSRFLSVASAKGFSPKTIQVYREHLHCISKHLDVSLPLSLLTKADLESAVASMRESNLIPSAVICGRSTPFYPGVGKKDTQTFLPQRIRLRTPGKKPIQMMN